MTLIRFCELLKSVCDNVSHFESENDTYPKIIYAETGRNYYHADNKVKERRFEVEVHFYTKLEFDPIFERLEDLFIDNDIPFDLQKIEHGKVPGQRTGVTYYLFKCVV